MHHFIFPSKDTWISSGSNKVTGEKFTNQNFGRDQILEIKKQFFNFSFDFPTRALEPTKIDSTLLFHSWCIEKSC